MVYKSNKQARQEYLDNELKNKESNRRAYESQKQRRSSPNLTLFVIVALLVLAYIVLSKHH